MIIFFLRMFKIQIQTLGHLQRQKERDLIGIIAQIYLYTCVCS